MQLLKLHAMVKSYEIYRNWATSSKTKKGRAVM